MQPENKDCGDWTSLFHLNQFAFAVWNCCNIYQVLAVSPVHRSWNARICPLASRPDAAKLVDPAIHGAMRKRKIKHVKSALEKQSIADTLLNASKNITSAKNLYLFQLSKLHFHGGGMGDFLRFTVDSFEWCPWRLI